MACKQGLFIIIVSLFKRCFDPSFVVLPSAISQEVANEYYKTLKETKGATNMSVLHVATHCSCYLKRTFVFAATCHSLNFSLWYVDFTWQGRLLYSLM